MVKMHAIILITFIATSSAHARVSVEVSKITCDPPRQAWQTALVEAPTR
jgi:hypothetical protein